MRRILTILGLLFGLTLFGTVGLHLITGERWFLCLYMAVITLTTVGFSEAVKLNDAGRVFVIFYLVIGLGTFTYSAFQLGQWIVSARVRSLLERRRMQKEIAGVSHHYIVCGVGRMGETICRYLEHHGKQFVAIDSDAELLVELRDERGWLVVHGDATDDEALREAGIERAISLASVLATDADNVYVVISARLLSPNLQIITRASDEKAVQKIERAGANRVVSPFSSGAVKMARFMISPSIEDFLEIADVRGSDLELADVQIGGSSPYVGKSLSQTDLSERGVMVIGIRRSNGERLMPPPGGAVIQAGDSLFAFGSARAVNEMIGETERGGKASS